MTARRSPSDRGNRRIAQAPEERRAALRRFAPKPSDAETSEEKRGSEATDDDEGSVETQPVTPGRRRLGGLGALIRLVGAGILLGGGTLAIAFGAYHYAQTSPRFALRQIEVDGLRRVSRDNILARAGVRTGLNVFSIDTNAIGQKIIEDRWVQEVKVERRLPATIRIRVVERDAGALAMVGDSLLVVTRAGEPFKRFEPTDPADLAVITGVSLDEPGREPAVERRRIATALEVLRHYERTATARNYPAQEAHLTPGGEVVLTIGKQGIALHLGAGPWAKKIAMAERVLGKLQTRKGNVSMMFLDNRAHPERVVVRMR
jgi:cell division protein FtsQ